MRLANIDGRAVLVSPSGQWVDVEHATGRAVPADPMVALCRLDELRGVAIPADSPLLNPTALGPPVPRPQKILAAGINYFEHAREAGFETPDQPLLFSKLPSAVCGPNEPIVIPRGRRQVDWEAEVVVVIGRRAHRVSVADAWSCVAGLTAGQDISDREEQFRSLRQFTMGKSFDTFAPVGPVLVTPDELQNANDVAVRCWIDGELVQSGSTADFIFNVPEIVSWASQISTLYPGDLVFTGTPSGVGYTREPPRFLRPGSLLETEVEGVGRLSNRCIEGPAYVTPTYSRAEPISDVPTAEPA